MTAMCGEISGSQLKKQSPGSYAMTERQSAVLCSALSVSVISNMRSKAKPLKVNVRRTRLKKLLMLFRSCSVISNMYLVCAALKLVILTFKIFTFIDDFVYGAAIVFFRYLNV